MGEGQEQERLGEAGILMLAQNTLICACNALSFVINLTQGLQACKP